MEVLQITDKAIRSLNKEKENNSILFERKWQHSISGDEFVKKTHEHIEKLYAARDNKQNNCEVFL